MAKLVCKDCPFFGVIKAGEVEDTTYGTCQFYPPVPTAGGGVGVYPRVIKEQTMCGQIDIQFKFSELNDKIDNVSALLKYLTPLIDKADNVVKLLEKIADK